MLPYSLAVYLAHLDLFFLGKFVSLEDPRHRNATTEIERSRFAPFVD